MVKIRLLRTGRKNLAQYRIVVIPSTSKRDGKYIENIGIYHPMNQPALFQIERDRFEYWISKGAQVSEGLGKIMKNNKLWKK